MQRTSSNAEYQRWIHGTSQFTATQGRGKTQQGLLESTDHPYTFVIKAAILQQTADLIHNLKAEMNRLLDDREEATSKRRRLSGLYSENIFDVVYFIINIK